MKLLKLFIISLLTLGLVACGADEPSAEKVETGQDVKDRSSMNPHEEKRADMKAQLGETLDVGGVLVTLISADRYQGKINPYEPLKQDHAMAVKVIVQNTTRDSIFVDSMEFRIYDKDGYELGWALPETDMALSSELPGGKKIEGFLYYDVPNQSGATWEIIYTPMFTASGAKGTFVIPAK